MGFILDLLNETADAIGKSRIESKRESIKKNEKKILDKYGKSSINDIVTTFEDAELCIGADADVCDCIKTEISIQEQRIRSIKDNISFLKSHNESVPNVNMAKLEKVLSDLNKVLKKFEDKKKAKNKSTSINQQSSISDTMFVGVADKYKVNGTGYSRRGSSEYHNICWKCKRSVSSVYNKRCPRCNWYICICGSCGCNRH